MIVTKLEGRLGNQLFQYALGRCLENTLKTDLKNLQHVIENANGMAIIFAKNGVNKVISDTLLQDVFGKIKT